jgi:hypothetical protein
VIQKNQQNAMNNIIQTHYQKWIEKQSDEVKKQVLKNYIGVNQIGSLMARDWFALSCESNQ